MTVSSEVQSVLDLARQNKTLVGSVDAGVKALTALVAQLQSQIGQASSLSAEDKAALTDAASNINDAITTLQTDIPAGVTSVGSAGSGDTGSNTGAANPPTGAQS